VLTTTTGFTSLAGIYTPEADERGAMQASNWQRRSVLASGAAIALTRGVRAQLVAWSSGTEPAKTKAPPYATDCHHHIYDSRFPVDPNATLKPGDATVADYRLLQNRIGTSRNVVIQPRRTVSITAACWTRWHSSASGTRVGSRW
jgi:hypothetical protein